MERRNTSVGKECSVAEPIISVSGLRGIVGETLTPEVAIRYAAAFAAIAPAGPIRRQPRRPALGRDAGRRRSRPACRPSDATRSTPASPPRRPPACWSAQLRAAGGIQITASHNPSPYNGLKLFSADGRVIPAGPGQEVLERYRAGQPRLGRRTTGSATAYECDDTLSAHLEAVLATVDVERIRSRRFRVAAWTRTTGRAACWAGGCLEELGCQVDPAGRDSPTASSPTPPEPTAENLAGVLSAVTEAGADVGFCQDPDADRLAVIDESGRYLGEEYTLAMCVDHVLAAAARGRS